MKGRGIRTEYEAPPSGEDIRPHVHARKDDGAQLVVVSACVVRPCEIRRLPGIARASDAEGCKEEPLGDAVVDEQSYGREEHADAHEPVDDVPALGVICHCGL